MAELPGGWDPAEYGDRLADVYDDWYDDLEPAMPAAVEMLAGLAGDGPALELGIGTGRAALPLAAAGVKVVGIDASERMVGRLWSKPGGTDISVTIGDFGDPVVLAEAAGPFGGFQLIYVVFNTFFALPSQEEQVRCFAAVAGALAPGGAFAMRAFVPDQCLFPNGTRFGVEAIAGDESKLIATVHDRNSQTVRGNHIVVGPRGIESYPVNLRYAFPAELDLMAALAGLTRASRHADWAATPFTSTSPAHVSVWRKPA
ncbi:class I SAM-dependent methyltransferase [Frankia sp. CNm7]|uniref:Class I SAM-dependent methyltransferase n=1 Tax=Frankia nepalensis TaxID=1836974 RepID=A0A937RLN1_9ACTN|nr:class I SAM-dependent methyltransferase [Frankia nepalensis]MBL7497468.1 class I SAM-dependent methyltransferase [Frankia nepalensis]MBL7509591.1 class I SAM-dependent methyltransferase [Frankia nepalensis]MBL7524227.1 class I SAM-dependent methyltransferase [Frankia nepalensis]MBL7629604.1 class I SAM-dependent methyltransferase [Frankia nepalensis]